MHIFGWFYTQVYSRSDNCRFPHSYRTVCTPPFSIAPYESYVNKHIYCAVFPRLGYVDWQSPGPNSALAVHDCCWNNLATYWRFCRGNVNPFFTEGTSTSVDPSQGWVVGTLPIHLRMSNWEVFSNPCNVDRWRGNIDLD